MFGLYFFFVFYQRSFDIVYFLLLSSETELQARLRKVINSYSFFLKSFHLLIL
jgi:hypothetical protein